MGKLGERIKALATAKVRFVLMVGGEKVEMFYDFGKLSAADVLAWEYGKSYAEEKMKDIPPDKEMEQGFRGEGRIRYLACAGFRDEEGEPVFDSPEEIPVGPVFMQIQMFVMRDVMGINPTLGEAELKK